MAPDEGIEPPVSDLESPVFPLHQSGIWSGRRDSNPRFYRFAVCCFGPTQPRPRKSYRYLGPVQLISKSLSKMLPRAALRAGAA
jgi:hypothetical protein